MTATPTGEVKPFRREQRERILGFLGAKDGWTCHYCSLKLASYAEQARGMQYWRDEQGEIHSSYTPPLGVGMPTIDHKVPISRGGTHHADNLVMSCYACNSQKCHLFAYQDFLEKKRAETPRTKWLGAR